MSDIRTVPLWPLTSTQARRLVEIQQRRQDDALTGGDTRPEGLRLSTECAIRRVKSLYEPRLRFVLDERLAARGFFAEDLAEAVLFPDLDSQVPIKWGPAGSCTSAWDFLAAGGTPISIKSTTKSVGPSAANRRQDERMMTADGLPPGSHVATWMVDVSALVARGPYITTLTEERYAACMQEIVGSGVAWLAAQEAKDPTKLKWWDDDAAWLDLFGLTCTCGGCILRDVLDGNAAIEARITRYHVARQQRMDAEEEEKAMRETLIEAAADLLAARPDAKSIRAYTKPYNLTRTKTGSFQIRERVEHDEVAS